MLYQRKSMFVSLLLLLLMAIPMTASADDDGPEWRGIVESRPAGTHLGTWMIGGSSFTVNGATEIEFEYGPTNVGSCVEVEYYTAGATNIATELESEEAHECDSSGGSGYAEAYGTITTIPTGYVGTWVIGGVSYTATATTYFEQDDGLFAIGGCAEVKYNPTDLTTYKIETDDHCGGSSGGSGYAEIEGVVTSFPAGLIGTWVVNNVSYEATASTAFSQEDGPFVTNACVEIRYDATSQTVYKIETEDSCGSSSGGSGYVETYGTVDSFPADLIGTWVISGVSYTTTNTTFFQQDEGPFAVSACVEIRYSSATSTVYKIETDNRCGGGTGNNSGSYARTYATVESFPAGLVGSWVANGVSYTASATTVFEQEDGTFAVGSCIEIDYLPTTFDALKIETASAYHCGGNSGGGHHGDDNERYGMIDSFPSGLIGTWTIDGIAYEAGVGTQFEQEDGAFAIGACVEVKSILQGTTNIALEIETENSYHCGGSSGTPGSYQSIRGTLDSFPAALLGSWVVDGVTYTADMTTLFKPDDGAFANGVCVEVTFQTSNNLALEIETEDAYYCGNAITPPTSGSAGLHANHTTGADGSYFVYTGENLPADSDVTIRVNGMEIGHALTNSAGWVTFAIEGSRSASRAAIKTQAVDVVVNEQTVDAPDLTLDNSQQQVSLPSNYSAPVLQAIVSPTAVALNGVSAEFNPQPLLFILLSVLLLTSLSVARLAPRTQE